MSGAVRHEAADGVLTVTLARPEKRNALDQAATAALIAVFEAAALDDDLRAIHLTAEGPDFCAGSDWVASNADGRRPRPASLVRRLPLQSHRLIELVLGVQVPVVATVRGFAAGLGCQLALAADFAVAAEDAVFWEPFVRRGFTPDTGASWLLPRLVGVARARRMLLLGEKVSGAKAAAWGLVHEAVPEPELDAYARDLVRTLADGPTVTLGLTKQLILRSAEAPLARAMVDESFGLELASRTADFREALAAFRERRPPDFTGR
ncbi:enoyl-CoA hydratase [Actinocorallia herbida]|uniref:Enoyl-CoA hydratase n=1 Tax=Actinocorallia herbida TaxID=58109 RepID=A0A3N1CV44_9ACTN|nr:enoyl-CoA hydratase-related protein [Actinocorallia herbida]ROO85162.1 enoyl-CoA hydratase [Actinocorallia herbida]